jgi:hypothetical protein
MTDVIVAFITARIADDEQVAQAALSITYGTRTETYAPDWPVEDGADDATIPEIGLLGGYTMTPGYIAPEHVQQSEKLSHGFRRIRRIE